jgi:hypothetical protein
MLPSDWTNAGITDGDYNDYVAYVSGCFDDSGGGPEAGGAAGAEGAGAPNAAGAANSGGGGKQRRRQRRQQQRRHRRVHRGGRRRGVRPWQLRRGRWRNLRGSERQRGRRTAWALELKRELRLPPRRAKRVELGAAWLRDGGWLARAACHSPKPDAEVSYPRIFSHPGADGVKA